MCERFMRNRETFHLPVDYFDRYFLFNGEIAGDEVQLIASTALVIASKVEVIKTY